MSELRPLAELRTHGLLWLINRVAFHPRGFALGIDVDTNEFTVLGDGTEPWRFDPSSIDEDEPFRAVEEFFDSLRPVKPKENA